MVWRKYKKTPVRTKKSYIIFKETENEEKINYMHFKTWVAKGHLGGSEHGNQWKHS